MGASFPEIYFWVWQKLRFIRIFELARTSWSANFEGLSYETW